MDTHWSHKVCETTLSFSPGSGCPVPLGGGSELGEFCMVGRNVNHSKIIYHSGNVKLNTGDIILEVQGQKVAGYTSRDLQDWIDSSALNSNPFLIKTAIAGEAKAERLGPSIYLGVN